MTLNDNNTSTFSGNVFLQGHFKKRAFFSFILCIFGNYLEKCPLPSTNLEKIYTSPYRSFNFQQLFFYDIFFAQRVFYELSVVKV